MTDYDPYVADPAEPPARRRLAGATPAVWTMVVLILVVAGATLFLQGRGQEDPALSVPSDAPTQQEDSKKGNRNRD